MVSMISTFRFLQPTPIILEQNWLEIPIFLSKLYLIFSGMDEQDFFVHFLNTMPVLLAFGIFQWDFCKY